MRASSVTAALAVLAFAASCATSERSEIPRTERPAPASFDRALVARGAILASIGNCRGCHTAKDGRSYAGGLGIETPFGTVYSPNLTPDTETGIGRWSEEAFARAMREGIDRRGEHLYPAFPYDHYTLVTDEDNRALYAFLMTREPVSNRKPANHLVFPFNIRATVGVWKRLYFHPGAYRPDPSKSATWNRGAYLSEGLGHCGACHTPRNHLGAEKKDRAYDGGEVEGWHAYAINAKSAAAMPWTEDSLVEYLRRGWHAQHGMSRGPMSAVTGDLAGVPEADVRAIAAYFVEMMGARSAAPTPRPNLNSEGMDLFLKACRQCHHGGPPFPMGGVQLHYSIGLTGEDPRNFIIVTLFGIPAAQGETGPVMPGFASALDDRQMAELARALRANFTDKPPWTGLEKIVGEVRAAGPEVAQHPPGGQGTDPASLQEARR